MKKNFLGLFMLFLVVSFCSTAQVKTNFKNIPKINIRGQFSQFLREYDTLVDFQIPAKDINLLLEAEKIEISKAKEEKPYQIAVPVPVNIDLTKLIKWVNVDQTAFGKFKIKLNGALCSSISFDKFHLPKGSELYVYNEKGNMITGPVTENENNPNHIWGSWIYKGSSLIVELKVPKSATEELQLHADTLLYGYKDIYMDKVGSFGASSACNTNQNPICSFGNSLTNERNSVALILLSGGGVGTGSLVANTCNTNRPFLLTASHVYATSTNVAAWRFTFQAYSPTCSPPTNTDGVTFSGATFRANGTNDFCLLELNSPPPANSGIYYAGWNRSSTPAQSAMSLHHPHGDVMKIAIANSPVTRSNYYGAYDHWQANWNTGLTEPGSSGAPLFDQNNRIVGELQGGPSFCGGTSLWDYYSSFDISWTGGGTNSTRLSNWLDPSNSGIVTTNTVNVANLVPYSLYLVGDDAICSTSNPYQIPNLPAGAIVSWSVSPSGITLSPTTPNNATTTLTKNTDGVVTLTATISNLCGGGTPIVVTKSNIVVGTPHSDLFTMYGQKFDYNATGYLAYYAVCPNEYLQVQPYFPNNENIGIINQQWSITGNYSFASSSLTTGILNFNAPPTVGDQTCHFTYHYQNSCGWSPYYSGGVSVNDCDGGMEPYSIKPPKVTEDNTSLIESQTIIKTDVFPNPANKVLHVTIGSSKLVNTFIKIYDLTGKQIKKVMPTSQTTEINITNLANGVYIIEIFDGIKSTIKKIIRN